MVVMIQPETTDGTVVVKGSKLFTRRRPGSTRPPLLLVHGVGGSLDSWHPLLDALPDRDIVMVDCPGTGQSGVPLVPLRLPAIADRIAGAVRTLGIEQVDVLGYSLGGMVAQELVRRHPDHVRRLVLVSTTFGLGAKPPGWRQALVLLSTRRHRNQAAAARDIPLLAGGRIAREPEVLAAALASRTAHPPSCLGYRYQQWAVIGWGSRRWLPTLRVPTLVLHGDEDPVVAVVNAERLAARIPHAQLEVVPEAGHMLLFDEPEKTAAILERFLDAGSPA